MKVNVDILNIIGIKLSKIILGVCGGGGACKQEKKNAITNITTEARWCQVRKYILFGGRQIVIWRPPIIYLASFV